MLQMLQRLIGEDINLIWEPAQSIESVLMDPSQVDHMLTNLLINDCEAIGHNIGKITIETALAKLDEDYCAHHSGIVPGSYVMIAVIDNGCSMDKETEANIFEQFYTIKAQGEGTGLGLATLYGIVKQNRGFINVYSESGQETTFNIFLPVYHIPAGKSLQNNDSIHSMLSGHGTILIVEDGSAILSMETKMLERMGYTVLAASIPGEAIRLTKEHNVKIDLLMTDVVMLEMKGATSPKICLGCIRISNGSSRRVILPMSSPIRVCWIRV